MKKILLPTDLTEVSLKPIHEILKNFTQHAVDIYVIHFISLPTSDADLLFSNQKKPYNAIPKEFLQALQRVKQEYMYRADRIKFDFVYCGSPRHFSNYLEGQGFDAVYVLSDYNYSGPLDESENVHSFFSRVKIPVIHVERKIPSYTVYQALSSSFTHREKLNNNPYAAKGKYSG